MEISKNLQIGVNYKDRGSLLNWEGLRFAEIVVIDKTHPSSYPLLYLLNDDKFTQEDLFHLARNKSFSFAKDHFLMVGKVLSIDKSKKHILLTDNNIIAYKLLVIAAGKKQVLLQETELAAALYTLNNTLRVKPKIPSSFPDTVKKTSSTPSKKPAITLKTKPSHPIKHLAHPHTTDKRHKSFDLDALDSRIYEVHT